MTAADLIAEVRGLGIVLAVEEERLRFRPRSLMTPDLTARLKSRKADVLALLRRGDGDTTGDSPRKSKVPSPSPDPVAGLIARLNSVFPADCRLSSADWESLRPNERGINEARERGIPSLVEAACRRYELAVRAIVERRSAEAQGEPDLWSLFDEPIATAADEPCPYPAHPRWRSIYGPHRICAVCHPPANPEVVAEWIEEVEP